MSGEAWAVDSEHTLEMFINNTKKLLKEGKSVTYSYKVGKTRSTPQNNALHRYLGLLATSFNDAGLDMRKVLKPAIMIPWSTDSAKEYLFHPIMKALTGLDTTKKLNTEQLTKVYETLNRHTAEKFGISLPFPSKD